jgi:ATP-dependent RNA helicase RhlE
MFDMGFLPDIRRIIRQIPGKRQTLLFSATMPDQIRHLANEVLKSPTIIKVGHTAPAETVRHALFPIAPHLKTPLLMELLRLTDTKSVLVFTRTKQRAKRVGEQLARAGYRSTSLQGNLSQGKRQAALNGFRNGTYQILVATDIAARGIDVTQISHVINYDIPSTPEAYIHRIGRTGRATRSGDAFTLITAEDIGMAQAIDRILGSRIERRTLPGFDGGPLAATDAARIQTGPASFTQRKPATPSAPRAQRAAGRRRALNGRLIPASNGGSRHSATRPRRVA